ncbi:hypothetical protein R5R35_014749 [Gryllus longicercus]|uniref:Major facilitator superfamily associated domain-containing protein n=1 Tax=Gryllus longicercus TaxID=2509291 RepID=A0AAN9UZA5_9ORTH
MKNWKSDRSSLRCLLFCFFGGIGCLFPYLPMHMQKVGLTENEPYVVSIVAPLVAALGPLFVCPLADRIGGAGGRSMRILLAIVILLSAICYPLLMCIPHVLKGRGDLGMNFICDADHSEIWQTCSESDGCNAWPQTNAFVLHSCRYNCMSEQVPLTGELETTVMSTTVDDDDILISEVTLKPLNVDSSKGGNDDDTTTVEDDDFGFEDKRRKRDTYITDDSTMNICFKYQDNSKNCHMYSKHSNGILISGILSKATENSDYCRNGCKYTVNGNFSCHIPKAPEPSCKVLCSISPPECSKDTEASECWENANNGQITFWSYLVVRSIADIFPTTAVGLLDAAIVIATCETNLGHGDVGRELVFGSLGFAIFAPVVGYLNSLDINNDLQIPYMFSFITFAILMVISTLILLISSSMPLSRPEWWTRHARVMPLGGIKRHLSELVCLVVILVILGILWSGIDSFLPWHLNEMNDMKDNTDSLHLNVLLGLTLTVGSLPAILLLWNSEKVVEFCGHTNLLIIAFIFYIVRYAAYSYMQVAWWALASEALEVFTMSIMWVTVILYMRQLVPRHLTVTSQGMAVFFHFCLGRCFGSVFAALLSTYTSKGNGSFVPVYQVGALLSAIVASIYFTVYHCCLKWFCQPVAGQTSQDHQEISQGPTSNGTYAPLRIYHNGSGQKEQVSY